MKDYLKSLFRGTKEEYFKSLHNDLKKGAKKIIVTVNPETIMLAQKEPLLSKMLNDSNVSKIPDGIAVVKACQKLNIKVKERITGIDVASYLLDELNKVHKSLYLFGAKQDILDMLITKLNREYPNLKLLGASNGYIANKDAVFQNIIKLKPDVCMIGMGIPIQEKLIYKHINKISNGIYIGVGGSFDVLSGFKKRAPKIFIKLNLEWLYRLIKEPFRIKRFWNNNVKFLFMIKKKKP